MSFQYLFVLCLALCVVAFTFSPHRPVQARVKGSSMYMGGGRSPSEQGMTNRQMFKDLRSKLNEKAKDPSFFDKGDAPEIELYCKSNKDGTQIGDCPFAQFIQLVMLKKGIRYSVHPTLPDAKPDFVQTMPTIVHKGTPMSDSLAIGEYLEKNFPHSTLTRQGAYSYQEILEKTNGFFPALAAYIKNKDAGQDAALQATVDGQLDMLDELLRSTPGQYFCGIELTLADLYLLPQLFHAMVTIERFKGIEIYKVGSGNPVRPALENYLARMLDMDEFNDSKAYYPSDQIIYGWKVARGDL